MSSDKTGSLCSCGHQNHFGKCNGKDANGKSCTCETIYYGNTGFSNKL